MSQSLIWQSIEGIGLGARGVQRAGGRRLVLWVDCRRPIMFATCAYADAFYGEHMRDLDAFAGLSREVNGLVVVSPLRADATIQSSLVNADVMASRFDDQPVLAFVTYGQVKLTHRRARPQISLRATAIGTTAIAARPARRILTDTNSAHSCKAHAQVTSGVGHF